MTLLTVLGRTRAAHPVQQVLFLLFQYAGKQPKREERRGEVPRKRQQYCRGRGRLKQPLRVISGNDKTEAGGNTR
jgi:hypothetical protein